jgi:1,4-alpha-glucan branching enzyme
MYAKGTRKGTVRFSLKSPGASKISIAGDFNQWKPESLKKQKDGSFALTLTLSKGTYEYKFIVDSQWLVDPDNNAWALNPFGTLNSVAQVE